MSNEGKETEGERIVEEWQAAGPCTPDGRELREIRVVRRMCLGCSRTRPQWCATASIHTRGARQVVAMAVNPDLGEAFRLLAVLLGRADR